MFLDISSFFYRITIWLFVTIILTIHLLISLGTLLVLENIALVVLSGIRGYLL